MVLNAHALRWGQALDNSSTLRVLFNLFRSGSGVVMKQIARFILIFAFLLQNVGGVNR